MKLYPSRYQGVLHGSGTEQVLGRTIRFISLTVVDKGSLPVPLIALYTYAMRDMDGLLPLPRLGDKVGHKLQYLIEASFLSSPCLQARTVQQDQTTDVDT